MPGRGRSDPSGFILTTVLGIAGAYVGRWLLIDILELTSSVGFIGSVIGAMVLLFGHRVLAKR